MDSSKNGELFNPLVSVTHAFHIIVRNFFPKETIRYARKYLKTIHIRCTVIRVRDIISTELLCSSENRKKFCAV
jgi:hypothetical protein